MSRFSTRLRFSLRTLLIGMLVVSALGGWIGIKSREVLLQRDAVAKIQALGGSVQYGEPCYTRWFGYQGRGAGWARTTFPNWVCSVEQVDINNSEFGDDEFPVLTQLPSLRALDLLSTGITDEVLQSLSRFPKLNVVILSDTKITEQGIDRLLTSLPRLVTIYNGRQYNGSNSAGVTQ